MSFDIAVSLPILFLAISALILIHEIGHFLVARYFGIWVEEFGLGLPPRIYGKKIGETIYSINLLPIGGFVKLHGEEEPANHKVQKPQRAFYKRPWWQRSCVLVAGVVMNFLLALVIISYLFTQGVSLPSKVSIREVASNSPAEKAGIQKGDILVKIGEVEITDVNQITKIISQRGDAETSFILTRIVNDKTESITLLATPRKNPPQGEGALGIILEQHFSEKRFPIYTAPYHGLKVVFDLSGQLVQAIVGVFWGFISGFRVPKDVAGPIGMYQLYDQARKIGFSAVLELSGLISLNLAVINLFPIPPLDGSRLLFVLIEGISGKKLKKGIEEKLYRVSFLFLIMLFILISIQDIRRLFGI